MPRAGAAPRGAFIAMARKRDPEAPGRLARAISLRTLLLVFTGGLLLALLLVAFMTSYSHFRSYVLEQLSGQARDGATAVGLSLSNAIDGSDAVAAGSLIDAVYDSGRYLEVMYLDHQGTVIAGRRRSLDGADVPGWFRAVVRLPLPQATAEVVRGWRRLGTVQVTADPQPAYRDLWRITSGLVVTVLLIGGGGLVALFYLLTRALRPLSALEAQARAIGDRDFRRHVTVRSTRELNQVTVAMNQMADDLARLFEGQGRLIQHLRRVSNEDPVTGLASRAAFEQRLKTEVDAQESAGPGVLMLICLRSFAGFNESQGRAQGDRLLLRVAGTLTGFLGRHAGGFAGRQAGAEFAVFLPGALAADAEVWGRSLVEELDGLYTDMASPADVAVHAGLAHTDRAASARELLAAADDALRQAQAAGPSGCRFANGAHGHHHNPEAWRAILEDAVAGERVALWLQPMTAPDGRTSLFEAVSSRLQVPDGPLRASVFVPMAERFGLIEAIDRCVVSRALARLAARPGDRLAVSISGASVASDTFRQTLLLMLEQAGEPARRLWIGITEQAVHHHRPPVGLMVRALGELRVPVLVDRFGVGGVPFSYLRNLPFQALRIDPSFVHGLDQHDDNRFYLESVVAIARSRGILVFAGGVETASEYAAVRKLGLDGAMGYHLGRPYPADH